MEKRSGQLPSEHPSLAQEMGSYYVSGTGENVSRSQLWALYVDGVSEPGEEVDPGGFAEWLDTRLGAGDVIDMTEAE